MQDIQATPATIAMTVEITRADTGITETFNVVGTVTPGDDEPAVHHLEEEQ
jgi:hypothetical protein